MMIKDLEISIPLVVDLDGTLIRKDSFHTSLLEYLFSSPLNILKVILWGLKGRSFLKHKLGTVHTSSFEHLIVNQDVVKLLSSEKEKGRRIVLATGTNSGTAAKFSQYKNLFDEYYSSTINLNLSGINKKNKLQEVLCSQDYIYMGNSKEDLLIWEHCKYAIIVNASKSTINKAQKITEVLAIIE